MQGDLCVRFIISPEKVSCSSDSSKLLTAFVNSEKTSRSAFARVNLGWESEIQMRDSCNEYCDEEEEYYWRVFGDQVGCAEFGLSSTECISINSVPDALHHDVESVSWQGLLRVMGFILGFLFTFN